VIGLLEVICIDVYLNWFDKTSIDQYYHVVILYTIQQIINSNITLH